MDKHSYIT